jgi:hypothetical protein
MESSEIWGLTVNAGCDESADKVKNKTVLRSSAGLGLMRV